MSKNEEETVINELVYQIKRNIFALKLQNGDVLEREVIAQQCDIDLFTADKTIATLGDQGFARTYMANKIAIIKFSSQEIWDLSNWLCRIGKQVIPSAVKNLQGYELDIIAEQIDLARRCNSAEAALQNRRLFHSFLRGDAPWKAKLPIASACADYQKYLEYYLLDRKRKITYTEFLNDFFQCIETKNCVRACEIYEWYTLLLGRTVRDLIKIYTIH